MRRATVTSLKISSTDLNTGSAIVNNNINSGVDLKINKDDGVDNLDIGKPK